MNVELLNERLNERISEINLEVTDLCERWEATAEADDVVLALIRLHRQVAGALRLVRRLEAEDDAL